jgi:tetratricopeptide (TPR) repeat protein
MELGRTHGIRLRFEDGLLTAIRLDVHHKTTVPVTEALTVDAGALNARPHAVDPLERPGFLRTFQTVAMTQALGEGRRDLVFAQSVRTGMLHGRVVATLEARFTLARAAVWTITLDGTLVTGAPDDKVRIRCGQNVYLSVHGSVPVACTRPDGGPATLRADLPAGESSLVLAVVSNPDIPVTGTVIVCRPDQVREAAIVVSCLPADRFTAVITVRPPPMREDRYRQLQQDLAAAGDASSRLIGGALGLAEVLAAGPGERQDAAATIERSLELRRAAARYDSWLRHQQMVATLLDTARVGRVVYLCGPEPGTAVFETIDEQLHLPQPGTEDGTHLADLAALAWRHVGGHDDEPTGTIAVPAGDRSAYPAALFVALRAGLPLHPAPDATRDTIDAQLNAANAGTGADEAVIVELHGDADDLLGAIYASHRAARFTPTPAPDLGAVREAVAAYDERILGSAARRRDDEYLRDGWFTLTSVRDHIDRLGPNRFEALEQAVTAQVPAAAVELVGDRRLTAFTAGLPYPFVRTGSVDWSGKPIGHVTGDPLLIILGELCAAGAQRPQATFSVVFDPGFFETSETQDVARSVDRHYTHPILLTEEDAGLPALRSLAATLPVELLFFNTHGTDDAIVLSDITLSRDFIAPLVAFDSLPIVFNNSCESWTGVGREFIRAGARGYVGSLWSIPADLAAEFGGLVVDRITADATPVAAALVGTGLSEVIARSYIYAGTVNGRLDQWPERAAAPGEAAIAACLTLLDAAERGDPAIFPLLARGVDQLLPAVESTPFAGTTEHGDVLFGALALAAAYRSAADEINVDRLAGQAADLVDRLPLTDGARATRKALLHQLSGHRHDEAHDGPAALAEFLAALDYGDACPDRPLLQLRVAELLADRGDAAQALEYATLAQRAYTDAGDEDGLLTATGTIGQLQRRLGDVDASLRTARAGSAAARGSAAEARFKSDEASAMLRLGDYPASAAAATEALHLYRAAGDDRGELSAYGLLAQALIAIGEDLDRAERYVRAGIEQARRLREPHQEAAFLSDLGLVHAARDDHRAAVDTFGEAIGIMGELAEWDDYARTLMLLHNSAATAEYADGLWVVVLHGLGVAVLVHPDLRAALLARIVEALKSAAEHSTAASTRKVLDEVVRVIDLINRDGEEPDVRFVGDVAALIVPWTRGEDRTGAARDLDEASGGRFALAEYFARRHPRRRRFFRWR